MQQPPLPSMEAIDRLIRQGAADPQIRYRAMEITGRRHWTSQSVMAQDLLRWVQRTIVYVEDPDGYDTYQSVEATLQTGVGDCADQVILLTALLRARGIMAEPAYLDRGRGITHVLVVAETNDLGPVPMDPTNYAIGVGRWPAGNIHLYRRRGR